MEKKEIQEEITSLLRNRGVPTIGISASGEVPSVTQGFAPENILKSVRSVICYGLPIPKGVVYAESSSLALYWRYCNMAYRTLDAATNHLCILLEREGFSSSPIYACFPWKVVGREFWGLLPLAYWGEQAGLGRLTKCGLLANPIYGSRILVGGLITALDLEPTEKVAHELCPEGCVDCIKACPVGAIGATGKVDHNLCIRHSTANPLLVHVLADPSMKGNFPFEMMVNTIGVDDHGSYNCFECMRVCPLNG
jgi:epoxyqueuosine reductase QueG